MIVGIDPHKKRPAAVTITQGFTTQAKFKFDNTREGLEMMLDRARVEMLKSGCRGVIFAIETGGHVTFTIQVEPGDANGDGVVNVLDLVKVKRIILGLDPPTWGADANLDDTINVLDLVKVKRIVLGLD